VATDIDLPIEEQILRLLHGLGLQKAHFAAREFQEFDGLARHRPEIVASLTLLFPPRTLKTDVLQPLGPRLLGFYGAKGPNAATVKKSFEELHDAMQVCFADYLDVNWSDVAADHALEIGNAMLGFLGRTDRAVDLSAANLSQSIGEIAGITYRVVGSGPAYPSSSGVGAIAMGTARRGNVSEGGCADATLYRRFAKPGWCH
jgi:hypothetical protein